MEEPTEKDGPEALTLTLTLTLTWQAEQAVPVDVGQLPQLPSARGVGRV